MFCIYGKSKILAAKAVSKRMLNKNSGISQKLAKLEQPSQAEMQAVIDRHVLDEFCEMKVKRCTHEFSTPHIAQEAMDLMLKDAHNFSDLIIMKKVNKLNAELKVETSKTTGKPKMHWVPLKEKIKQLAA